jgi:hypothetical protein
VRRERDEPQRFPRRIPEGREHLTRRPATARIDGRADEDHRADSFWVLNRKLRHDLATERVRHDRRPSQPDRL